MGHRPKSWPLGVNRWLVTFIMPAQSAKGEARQLRSEEFSWISMSKSKRRRRLSSLLAARCPRCLWQRQMLESLSGKTCHAGTQSGQQRNITSCWRFNERSLDCITSFNTCQRRYKNFYFKKAHVRMYRNTLLFDSETIGGGQRRPRPGGRSHARCPKRRECGKPQLEPRWHSHGRYDKGAIEFREQIWHWLIREHSSPGGRPTVALWRGTAAPHCFGGCVQVDRSASGRVGPEAKREWQHAVVRDN